MTLKSDRSMHAPARDMRRPGHRKALAALLVLAILLLAACGDESAATRGAVSADQGGGAGLAADTAVVGEGQGIEGWLQRVRDGEIPAEQRGESLAWGRGYLIYYGPVEGLGIDNLIYNALTVHKRMASGEIAAENLGQNERNLLDLTEGIEFNPNVEVTQQVAQTPEIREAIQRRIVTSQQELSPEEALAANEVVGVVALHTPADIGGKYLVFAQESPESDFTFLGVVVVVDATTESPATAETYSFEGWRDLPLLGDAAGPFWNDLPLGLSGDPANTDEGRPGVLLVSQQTYEAIAAGKLE